MHKLRMIFFHILIFIVGSVLLSLSISGYGRLINLTIKKNFFLEIFLGFILITFLITIIHFFFKINLLISVLVLTLGVLFFFLKENLKNQDYSKLQILTTL